MAQLNFHLVQVSLHLLLDPQGVVPAPDLRVQLALHGVHHPLVVPLDLLHLLFLLCDFPVHLALDLVELQLHTEDLGFLVFQSALECNEGSKGRMDECNMPYSTLILFDLIGSLSNIATIANLKQKSHLSFLQSCLDLGLLCLHLLLVLLQLMDALSSLTDLLGQV